MVNAKPSGGGRSNGKMVESGGSGAGGHRGSRDEGYRRQGDAVVPSRLLREPKARAHQALLSVELLLLTPWQPLPLDCESLLSNQKSNGRRGEDDGVCMWAFDGDSVSPQLFKR